MNFTFTRTLEDQVFSTQITCSSLGDATFTAEQEQALIDDFGPVIFDIGGPYAGKYKVEDVTGNVIVDSAAPSNNISFVVSNAKIELKPGVVIPYSVDAKKISATEMATHSSDTFANLPLKVAEAKCIIFEQTIETNIQALLASFKTQSTTFPNSAPVDFTA